MVSIEYYSNSNYDEVIKILKASNSYDDNWESKEGLSRKIKRDPQSILVAKENDKIVGCIFISEDGWVGFLWRLSVLENYRKKGIGKLLMQKGEEIIKKRGIKEVSILVNHKNNILKKWYEKQDYKQARDWTFMFKKVN